MENAAAGVNWNRNFSSLRSLGTNSEVAAAAARASTAKHELCRDGYRIIYICIKCHRRTAQSEIILMARIILRGDTANDSSSPRARLSSYLFFYALAKSTATPEDQRTDGQHNRP